MYDTYISWDHFEPWQLPVYKLWSPKNQPKKTIIRDYICLDTETSKGFPDDDDDYYMDSILLPAVRGCSLYVPEYVRNEVDWKHIRRILQRCKIQFNNNGFTISELYSNYQYLIGYAINEADQLSDLAAYLEKELAQEDKKKEKKSNKIGWIYQWCFSYPYRNGKRALVYGRTPSQLAYCFDKIREINKLDEFNKILIFVHNLSYDYTYFHGFLQEQFNEPGELLAVGNRKIITYTIAGLEFRDSLKISQVSLSKWGKDLGIRHKKLVGEIDYSITRYQDSPLTRKDWRYMFRDVVSLDECIEKQLNNWNDYTKSIPLTNTGYVRREVRKKYKKHKSNRDYFTKKALSLELYRFCRSEFAGGITHGNRFYANKTINIEDIRKKPGYENAVIKHRDFVSHYPSQQICKYCPSSQFGLYYDFKQDEQRKVLTHEDLLNMDKAYLAMIQIWNLKLRDGVTLPYAQEVKLLAGQRDKLDLVCDNGRVIKMLSGSSIICVNEHDFKWYCKLYTFQYKILKVYTAARGPFPSFITDSVKEFFTGKTKYKKEAKEAKTKYGENSEEYRAAHILELINKGLLNSVYGMSATDPVRTKYFENDDGSWDKEVLTDTDVEEKLKKYYSGKKNFMNYELGLWTTSHARDELITFVELIGWKNFLYADTDSIFYISTPEIEARIESYNARFREENIKNGWYIEYENKKVHFHQFDDEGENIIKFRFMHAKCYAYVTDDNKLHATIAGVPDKSADSTRVEELGDIENLIPGMVFRACGGTTTKYPPRGETVKPRIETVNGHDLEVSAYALIENTTKQLKSNIEREEQPFFWEVNDVYD